jgi:restriction system protein
VTWLVTDLPRIAFDRDLLYSFGASLTVSSVSRNDAERRVRAMIERA